MSSQFVLRLQLHSSVNYLKYKQLKDDMLRNVSLLLQSKHLETYDTESYCMATRWMNFFDNVVRRNKVRMCTTSRPVPSFPATRCTARPLFRSRSPSAVNSFGKTNLFKLYTAIVVIFYWNNCYAIFLSCRSPRLHSSGVHLKCKQFKIYMFRIVSLLLQNKHLATSTLDRIAWQLVWWISLTSSSTESWFRMCTASPPVPGSATTRCTARHSFWQRTTPAVNSFE